MNDGKPFYLADGTTVSSDGKSVKCPRCGAGVTPSYPECDCEDCGQTISFVVAKKGKIPDELADWAAAQSEIRELRTQVHGQEDFIQEHQSRLDRLEERTHQLPELDGYNDRMSDIEEKLHRLIQFESVVRESLDELGGNDE